MGWIRIGRSIGAGLIVAGLAGCGAGGDDSRSGTAPVVVEGSSTVLRISQAAQLGFKKQRREIKVLVSGKGTGTGFGRYLRGEVDVIDASRPAKPEEQSQAEEKGLDWTRFVVGYDGITVAVNPENTFAEALSTDQLKRLFEPGSAVRTWRDLDPGWPAREIVLFSPDNDSGTFEFFAEAILGAEEQRPDVQVSPDDNTLVTGVAGDGDGLGYFGYAYYAANRQRLRSVAIQDSEPGARPVTPSPETIRNGEYRPLTRPLFIYVKNTSMRQRPEVAAFVRYYLENIDTLATLGGYVPPSPEDREANRKALEALTSGAMVMFGD